MRYLRFRIRRWLFGPDPWPFGREALREWNALLDEQPERVLELSAGKSWWRVVPPSGLAEELAFRRYARGSGEVVAAGEDVA